MPVSQNGYFANDRSLIVSIKVPGGKLAVRKDYGIPDIFSYVAERFHSEVEPLKWPGCWGYAERKIRGGSSLSNHASGTAIDLNAPAHWLGAVGTFTNRQQKAIRSILNDCDGVIRWGGDYRGRKDEMHFEINKDEDSCRRLGAAIRSGKKPGPSGGATTSGGGGGSPTYREVEYGDLLKLYTKGAPVKEWQGVVGVKQDGYFGPDTATATKRWQKAHGLAADGIVGPKTWSAYKSGKDQATPKSPKFPFPSGHWMGVESSNPKNHSGYYKKDRPGIKLWQDRMNDRGWTISVDGYFGPQSEKVAKQFQAEKNLEVDGLVGSATFAAAWTEPVT